jgi:hypothetical protein
VRVDPDPVVRAISQLARATARFGGHESVSLEVDGPVLVLSPLSKSASPVVLGEEARELAAPAAAFLIEALGGALEARDETLVISLPAGGS